MSNRTDPTDRVGEALRVAVERTLAATAAPAAETRQRAEVLLDEVARRGRSARDDLERRGDAARTEVSRRGEAAREQVSRRGSQAAGRVAGVLDELRPSERQDPIADLGARIGSLEARIGGLEGLLTEVVGQSKAQAEPEEDSQKPL